MDPTSILPAGVSIVFLDWSRFDSAVTVIVLSDLYSSQIQCHCADSAQICAEDVM